ncbi:MAG: A/G-specific adenine glycosylase [Cyanobacteria bacterium P01_A01_bin.3]
MPVPRPIPVPSQAGIQWFQHQLLRWGADNLRDFPWRRTRNPYAIFVAEFLLQKTGAQQARRVYEQFLERYPTLTSVANANLHELETLLAPLGLIFRAERLHRAAERLLAEYGGEVPEQRSELLKLPGVGPYTANAICASAFGQRTPVQDVNVARILGRFFGLPPLKLPQRDRDYNHLTYRVAPHQQVARWNLTLLDFGALVCVARRPKCDRCPLSPQCTFSRSQ